MTDDAIARLRRHNRESHRSALLLADEYRKRGDVNAAVEELREAASRFDDPTFLARAAEMQAGVDLGAAVSIAEQALIRLPESAIDRTRLRRLLLQHAADDGDWPGVETQARSMVLEGDTDPTTRWALVMSLVQQGRLDEASVEMHRRPRLQPRDESEAAIWIRLVGRTLPSEDIADLVLCVAREYADSEQVVAMAIQRILMDSRDEPLGNEVVSTFRAVQEDFFNRFPESIILRRVTGESTEELVEEIMDSMRPARPIGEVARKISNLELPLGMLAAATGRLYIESLVLATGWCIPAQRASALATEIVVAEQALDGHAVIGADAIHLGSLIKDHWIQVRGAFRKLLIPRDSVLDAVASSESLSQRSTMSFSRHAETDTFTIGETSIQDANAMAERSQWIADQALLLDVVDGVEWIVLTDLSSDEMAAWLGPVELAGQQELPLLCDDAVLREVARQIGVSTFGTVSLLHALNRRGTIDDEALTTALLDLSGKHVVDLPLDGSLLTRLGESDAWSAGALTNIISRPEFWTNESALDRFRSYVVNACNIDPDLVAVWVGAGSYGVLLSRSDDAVPDAVAQLIASAMASSGVWTPAAFRAMVDAARNSLGDGADLDPMEHILKLLCSSLAEGLGAADGPRALVHLTSGLKESDREIGVRVVLGGCS